MKIRLRSWFKNHPVSYIGLGLCLIVALTAIAYPALAQSDPGGGGWAGALGHFGVDGLLDVLIKAVFSGLAFIGLAIAALVGNLCILLINSIILPGQNSLLFSSQIKDIWQVMLNLANLVFFISLVAFAIMIITRTGGYNLKKAITSLITTVVLANLSYQLVLVMIEAGDALRNLGASLLGFNPGEFATGWEQLKLLWDPSLIANVDANILKYILVSILALAMGLVTAFVLFRLVFILIERAIRITVLTIFGPLQIALGILPQKDVQGLAGNWFGELVKWVLVMPATFIILAIGQKLAPPNSIIALREFIITSWDPTTGVSQDQLTGTGDIFFGLISLGVMFAATQTPTMLKITLSSGVKFFTDFADKKILGGVQRNVGGGIAHGARSIADMALRANGGKNPIANFAGWVRSNQMGVEDKKNELNRRVTESAFGRRTGNYFNTQRAAIENRVSDILANNTGAFGDAPAVERYRELEQQSRLDKNADGTANVNATEDQREQARKARLERDTINQAVFRKVRSEQEQETGQGLRRGAESASREMGNKEAKINRPGVSFFNGLRNALTKYESQNGRFNPDQMKGSVGEDLNAALYLLNNPAQDPAKAGEFAVNMRDFLGGLNTQQRGTALEMLRKYSGGDERVGETFEDRLDYVIEYTETRRGHRRPIGGGPAGTPPAGRPAADRFIDEAKDAEELAQKFDSLNSQVSAENRDKTVEDLDAKIGTSISNDLKISTEEHQDLQQLSGESAKLLDQAFFMSKDEDASAGIRSLLSSLGGVNSPEAQSIVAAIDSLQKASGEERTNIADSLTPLLQSLGLNPAQNMAVSKLLTDSNLSGNDLKGMAAFAQVMDGRSANPADANYVADSKIRDLLGNLQDRDIKVQVEQTSEARATAQAAEAKAATDMVDEADNDRFVVALQDLGSDIRTSLEEATKQALSLYAQVGSKGLHEQPINTIVSSTDNSQLSKDLSSLLNKFDSLGQVMKVNLSGGANLGASTDQRIQALGQQSMKQFVEQIAAPAANAIKKLNSIS